MNFDHENYITVGSTDVWISINTGGINLNAYILEFIAGKLKLLVQMIDLVFILRLLIEEMKTFMSIIMS